jgi:hypothetical protein
LRLTIIRIAVANNAKVTRCVVADCCVIWGMTPHGKALLYLLL